MTEQEWFSCTDPGAMLSLVSRRASARKLQLFACACCRRVGHLLTDARSRGAVLAAERFADGKATDAEMDTVIRGAKVAAGNVTRGAWATVVGADMAARAGRTVGGLAAVVETAVAQRAEAAAGSDARINAAWAAHLAACCAYARRVKHTPAAHYATAAARFAALASGDLEAERAAQADLLRNLLGHPFRHATFDPTWRTPEVEAVARAIYEQRRGDSLAMLAAALDEAGCTDHALLMYCRAHGEYARGCWAVDLILGKE